MFLQTPVDDKGTFAVSLLPKLIYSTNILLTPLVLKDYSRFKPYVDINSLTYFEIFVVKPT